MVATLVRRNQWAPGLLISQYCLFGVGFMDIFQMYNLATHFSWSSNLGYTCMQKMIMKSSQIDYFIFCCLIPGESAMTARSLESIDTNLRQTVSA